MNISAEIRPMKELFEIVKKHHCYYNNIPQSQAFMCNAAKRAMRKKEISKEELTTILAQIKKWMMEISERTRKQIKNNDLDDLPSLAGILGLCRYAHSKQIKSWWDTRISSL